MKTRDLAAKLNITYGQLDYLLKSGVIPSDPVQKGKQREFTDYEVYLLGLAALLRREKVPILKIKREIQNYIADDTSKNRYGQVPTGPTYCGYHLQKLIVAYWNGSFWRSLDLEDILRMDESTLQQLREAEKRLQEKFNQRRMPKETREDNETKDPE